MAPFRSPASTRRIIRRVLEISLSLVEFILALVVLTNSDATAIEIYLAVVGFVGAVLAATSVFSEAVTDHQLPVVLIDLVMFVMWTVFWPWFIHQEYWCSQLSQCRIVVGELMLSFVLSVIIGLEIIVGFL